ncbi:MAG: ABC transporter permease [Candidatus Protochlamydia sp.]|nr:ABC transporter permease [Candidatus Protochlamydia sp.]
MPIFCLRKLFSLICSLWIVATLTFVLMKTIPGDPFSEEQALRADMHEKLLQQQGFNDPLLLQYGRYISSLLRGDLGYSLKHQGRSVNAIINEHFPVSALLGLTAFCLALGGGVLLGAWGALKEGKKQGHFVIFLTTAGLSIPSFILAPLLQYFFAIQLGWLPLARWGSLPQAILPSIALASLPAAFIAKLVCTSLNEVLQTDYIKAARAKGLAPSRVIFSHALRNALLPVLSYLGPLLANILVGSFIIEKIYSIPGLGAWFINSVMNRDYALIMGLTLFYSGILMFSIFLVDVAYGWLDPRLRIQTRER